MELLISGPIAAALDLLVSVFVFGEVQQKTPARLASLPIIRACNAVSIRKARRSGSPTTA
jgi:hypothetical protein